MNWKNGLTKGGLITGVMLLASAVLAQDGRSNEWIHVTQPAHPPGVVYICQVSGDGWEYVGSGVWCGGKLEGAKVCHAFVRASDRQIVAYHPPGLCTIDYHYDFNGRTYNGFGGPLGLNSYWVGPQWSPSGWTRAALAYADMELHFDASGVLRWWLGIGYPGAGVLQVKPSPVARKAERVDQ